MRAGLTTTVALMMTVSAWAADATGFAGKWQLDKKQTPATATLPEQLTQEIKQEGDTWVIRSRYREPKNGVYPTAMLGVMTQEVKLGPDVRNDIGPFQHQSKTRLESNSLITEWTAVNANGAPSGSAVSSEPLSGKWTRTLSEDGKTMTMQIEGAPGSTPTSLVFKRK